MASRLLLLTLLWGVLLGQAGAGEPAAEETPAQWLGRMNRSVSSLSFQGNFVYLSGRFLEAMRLRHQIVDGRPRESLFSLTGEPREIIRDADTLTIITWVDGKPRKITHPSSGRLSPLKPLDAAGLQRYYRLMMGKPARIAGRQGVVVALVPRDDLRYGYRLTLDRESALPLDLTVMDGAGNLVSRIMFTRLEVGEQVQAGEDLPAVPGEPARVKASVRAAVEEAAAEKGGVRHWVFHDLPAGFRLVNRKHMEGGAQEHFVFSDGLATVSVYIEPVAPGDHPFNGETSLGSVNAYGRLLGHHQLTAVGEVPHKTLRLLANALQPGKE